MSPMPTQTSTSEQKLVRLNVNMNEKTARELREVAEGGSYSITEVVRRAIALYRFIWGEAKKDRVIIIADRDGGNRNELVLL